MGVAFLELFESSFRRWAIPPRAPLAGRAERVFLLPHGAQARAVPAVKLALAPRHDLYRLASRSSSRRRPPPPHLGLATPADAVVAAFDKKANLKDELPRARALRTPAASEAPALAPARVLAELRETVGALLGPEMAPAIAAAPDPSRV